MIKGTIFSKITEKYVDELVSRIKEWCHINSQYDDKTRDEKNPFGKGVSEALKYFEDLAKELLEEWIEMRKENYDKLTVDAVFITKYNGEWHKTSKITLYNKIKKFGTIININDFRPHCIRKSRLNNIYDETGDLSLAASLANHRSIETTRSFYTKKKTIA